MCYRQPTSGRVNRCFVVGLLFVGLRYFCLNVNVNARCIGSFRLLSMVIGAQVRPGIVPSLGEGVDQDGVYRHCPLRM